MPVAAARAQRPEELEMWRSVLVAIMVLACALDATPETTRADLDRLIDELLGSCRPVR